MLISRTELWDIVDALSKMSHMKIELRKRRDTSMSKFRLGTLKGYTKDIKRENLKNLDFCKYQTMNVCEEHGKRVNLYWNSDVFSLGLTRLCCHVRIIHIANGSVNRADQKRPSNMLSKVVYVTNVTPLSNNSIFVFLLFSSSEKGRKGAKFECWDVELYPLFRQILSAPFILTFSRKHNLNKGKCFLTRLNSSN